MVAAGDSAGRVGRSVGRAGRDRRARSRQDCRGQGVQRHVAIPVAVEARRIRNLERHRASGRSSGPKPCVSSPNPSLVACAEPPPPERATAIALTISRSAWSVTLMLVASPGTVATVVPAASRSAASSVKATPDAAAASKALTSLSRRAPWGVWA